MKSVVHKPMDLNRSSDICRTDGDIPVGLPSDSAHAQTRRRTSEHGSIFDLEDDLFLGTDAQALFSMSGPPPSPGSSSVSTGTSSFHYGSSESTGVPGSHRVIKKLAHVGRLESSDSLASDFSDLSRTSHDVSSLLNAMTVDPEEFLTDLGFAEPDMRTRIPDRFLESPSKAHGIDVEQFRRSLDQEDFYGSPSQDSPAWSDPGSSRIPLRFITSRTEAINTALVEGYSSVPLIAEPEDAPEDSFDLMRHLRLNKPCHVTKGMFLEPVTEELEVSSVGSGSVRTKISRELSNEGTIVREESLEQANVESEVILDVPVTDSGTKESRELKETKVAEQVENDSQIVANFKAEEGMSVSFGEDSVIGCNSVKSSESDAVIFNNQNTEIQHCETSITDYNKNCVSGDLETKVHEEEEEFSLVLPNPAHLKVANVVVQDSFELEEIANEDFSEKESLSTADQETGLNAKTSEKRLTRENSGESSGFEEMLPDKDTLSPSSCSPTLILKRFSADAHVIVSDTRRPLAALLDPEMLSLAAEKARGGGGQWAKEVSPRATFVQRRTRSLTKQRPVDEDVVASWAFSSRSPALKVPASQDRSLGMGINHNAFTEYLVPSFQARCTKEPNIDFSNSSLDNYVGTRDENYNRTLKCGPEEPALVESHNSLDKPYMAPTGNLDSQLQNSGEPLSVEGKDNLEISQSEFSSGEIALRSEESISQSAMHHDISEQYNSENMEFVHLKKGDIFTIHGSENDLSEGEPTVQFGEETRSSSDLSVSGQLTEAIGACAEVKRSEESQKVDSEYNQHFLHEISVLEQSIQRYESTLCSGGPLDALRTSYYTKHMLARITEEVNAIQELRLLISSELERMKHLLAERRSMLLAGATKDPLGTGVSQKMADLLREQSSLNIGLSNIGDELSIRKKASRRARIYSHIESAKKELKEEREKCVREFRKEIKEALIRELSERFSSEIDLLRREVRSKDAVIEQLKKNQQQREQEDLQLDGHQQS